ncbi:MAG TPA: hypothetical protein VFB21_12305 [Chthonomonadaceae bacterium]|nr:hypothetical protein [Chthonomonadaceae bacterium]
MHFTKTARGALGSLLTLLACLGMGGCRWASGPGDTVETPPRALVEKTFRPPMGTDPRGAKADKSAPAPAAPN